MWISVGLKQLRLESSSFNTVINLHISQKERNTHNYKLLKDSTPRI